mmetsp:Transcript_21909/g.28385  ORF Transcript_21909/g.28385 Transcript_21909/m.28385 type:complete len:218 (-) Transcript_21909:129-782(-)
MVRQQQSRSPRRVAKKDSLSLEKGIKVKRIFFRFGPVSLLHKVSKRVGRCVTSIFDIARYQIKLQSAKREIHFLERQLIKEMKKRAHIEAKLAALKQVRTVKSEERAHQHLPAIAIHLGFLSGNSENQSDLSCGRPGHVIKRRENDDDVHCWGDHPGYVLGDSSDNSTFEMNTLCHQDLKINENQTNFNNYHQSFASLSTATEEEQQNKEESGFIFM